MPSAGKIKLDLRTYDDIFSTQEERDEQKKAKIEDIPLDQIDDFPDHPYKVRDDEDMAALIESVREHGVITPATVRQKEDGRYELISGHRRKRACEILGIKTLRSEIVDSDFVTYAKLSFLNNHISSANFNAHITSSKYHTNQIHGKLSVKYFRAYPFSTTLFTSDCVNFLAFFFINT